MTTTDLFEAALGLPLGDRVRLARELLESLDGSADPGADAAWVAEIGRRVEAIGRGEAELIDGDEAHRRIRARLETRRH